MISSPPPGRFCGGGGGSLGQSCLGCHCGLHTGPKSLLALCDSLPFPSLSNVCETSITFVPQESCWFSSEPPGKGAATCPLARVPCSLHQRHQRGRVAGIPPHLLLWVSLMFSPGARTLPFFSQTRWGSGTPWATQVKMALLPAGLEMDWGHWTNSGGAKGTEADQVVC